jgi:hypothetical protein
MELKIFCIYYNGHPIIKNQTLENALKLLDRSKNFKIGIQLNNN